MGKQRHEVVDLTALRSQLEESEMSSAASPRSPRSRRRTTLRPLSKSRNLNLSDMDEESKKLLELSKRKRKVWTKDELEERKQNAESQRLETLRLQRERAQSGKALPLLAQSKRNEMIATLREKKEIERNKRAAREAEQEQKRQQAIRDYKNKMAEQDASRVALRPQFERAQAVSKRSAAIAREVRKRLRLRKRRDEKRQKQKLPQQKGGSSPSTNGPPDENRALGTAL